MPLDHPSHYALIVPKKIRSDRRLKNITVSGYYLDYGKGEVHSATVINTSHSATKSTYYGLATKGVFILIICYYLYFFGSNILRVLYAKMYSNTSSKK